MLRDLEHPSINEVNRTGYINALQQEECNGIDVYGCEVLSGEDVVFDGDVIILKDNLERYLAENYDFIFQTVE